MPELSFAAIRSWPPPIEVDELLHEYKAWLSGQVVHGWRPGLPDARDDILLAAVCRARPSEGAFFLLTMDGQAAAVGGWRLLDVGVAELKRLYVRPSLRGAGLGRRMLEHLLSDARSQGCRHVCLDTAPFMVSARRLYLDHGFVDCAAHEGTEVPAALHPHWHFMRRSFEA